MTVSELIQQLQSLERPDSPVFFEYFLSQGESGWDERKEVSNIYWDDQSMTDAIILH